MTYSSAVGIDVSKKTLDVTIINNDVSSHNKFSNSKKGLSSLKSFLSSHNITSQTQIVMESTGDYHLLSAVTLGDRYNVKVINPLLAKQHMQTTVRKVKTDKVDSKLLAEIGLKQKLQTHKVTEEEIKKKKLIVLIDTLEKHLSALKLSVKNLERTTKDLGITLNQLTSLKAQIKSLELEKKKIHLELTSLVVNKKLVDDLSNIKGISQETAVKVVGIIEDRDFSNKRALVAFSGLDVSVKESGKWSGRTRITKRGNNQLRKYLIQIGWGLLMHNEEMQEYIAKYKEKGRKYLELLVILARKFLRMLYGSIKNQQVFSTKFA